MHREMFYRGITAENELPEVRLLSLIQIMKPERASFVVRVSSKYES